MRPEVKAGQKWRWLGKFNATMLTPGEAYEVLEVRDGSIFIDGDRIREGDGTTHTWDIDPEEGRRSFYDCFELVEPEAPHDPVEHPKHYTGHPSGVECITITEHMNFCLGNAVKYIWRAGEKGDALTDLKKARWYIDREIERMSKTA